MNLVSTFLLIISCISVVYTQDLNNGDNCRIERSEKQGICKPIGECPSLIRAYTTGSSVSKCGHDKRSLLACCPVESPVTPVTPNRPKRISETKCSEYATSVFYRSNTSHVTLIVNSRKENTLLNGCGNVAIQLIVGGIHANPKEFPHMALIGVTTETNQEPDWFCGGSLISDRFVLTAAHCFIRTLNIVRLGELDYANNNEDSRPQDYNISRQIIHPHYNFTTKYNDIALLELSSKVIFSIYKRPACLPSYSEITKNLAVATGWGLTSFHGDPSSSLQKVVLNLFNQSECIDIYSTEATSPVIGNQFCAGSRNETKDTCQGDSGGPLQVIHENEYCMYRIIGITSFGITCAVHVPGIYTRVYSYLDWIEEQVWGLASERIIFPDK